VSALAHDPITNTLAAAVHMYDDDIESSMYGWVSLDATGETVLGWRTIGPGFPARIVPDGAGGAYVLGRSNWVTDEALLGHYGPDPESPPSWEIVGVDDPIDLAIDHAAGRAYMLTDVGIDVYML
jgi:hypothetical protein